MEYSFKDSLGRITQQVSKGLGRILEKKFDEAGYSVNAAQWSVISYLNYNNYSSQKNISRFLGVNKVMTKRIIDRLEREDYVKRLPSKDDKRYNRIELTNKGKKLYNELKPFAEETLENVYSVLDNSDIKNCLYTLNKISDTLEKM